MLHYSHIVLQCRDIINISPAVNIPFVVPTAKVTRTALPLLITVLPTVPMRDANRNLFHEDDVIYACFFNPIKILKESVYFYF